MEDLGNININIREFTAGGGGGGGGGGGQPGGGPRVVPPKGASAAATPPAAPPAPPAPPALPAAQIPKSFNLQTVVEGLRSAGSVKGELSSFVSSPSISGLGELASTESATSQALAALGMSASAATAVILPLGIAVGAVVLGMKALSYAASETAKRIEEVARYSGTLMAAVGMERYQAVVRSIQDATANANAYTLAQRSATEAANAQASVQRDINAVLALGAIAWHKIVMQFNLFLKPFTALVGWLSRVVVPTAGVNAGEQSLGQRMLGEAGEWLMRIFVPFYGMMELFNEITEGIRKLLVWCGIIADNTKQSAKAVGVNDWFITEMQVMSQSKYDRPQPYRIKTPRMRH